MDAKISVIVLTYKRDDILQETLKRVKSSMGSEVPYKLILVDNNKDLTSREHFIEDFDYYLYMKNDFNAGVTGGRMTALRALEGEIAIFIDDDALLEVNEDFPNDLLNEFSDSPDLSVIAFRSFVGEDRAEEDKEFPHTNKKLDRNSSFDTFRFIGVAHAIRISHFREVGGYCEAFFYGMEEFDLSYRLLKKNYRIKYQPAYCVQHMKQEAGRLPAKNVIQRMYANKLAVGWMHLPIVYFLISAVAWFIKTTKDARSPLIALKSIGDFIAMASHGKLQSRKPSKVLAGKIQSLGGDAWR